MESLDLLQGIKSTYIIDNVFEYVENKSFKYKLLINSKKLQKLLKIDIQDYKKLSYEFTNYQNFSNFLLFTENSKSIKDLKEQFQKDIKNYKLSEEIFINDFSEIYFNKVYNNYKSKEEINKNILGNHLDIDIYSPFYESLKTKDIFEKLFAIHIPLRFIRGKNLKDDYIKAINDLYKYNPSFGSFHFELNEYNDYDLTNFQDLNQNIKIMKKLIIDFAGHRDNFFYESEIFKNKIREKFFLNLFSNSNIKDNLLYLEIKLKYPSELPEFNYENLNDLKLLEELRLENLCSTKGFSLKLNNLKYLYLNQCQNILLSENSSSNLIILNLFRDEGICNYKGQKLKCPKLEKFKICFCKENYSNIFDFKSFQSLKYFLRVNSNDFLELGNAPLEKVYISSKCPNFSKEIEIKILRKLIEIRTLKEVKIDLEYMNNDDIEFIEGENQSVEKLIVNIRKEDLFTDSEIILFNLQNKFPNLKEIYIHINGKIFCSLDKTKKKIDLIENAKCKINKFSLSWSKRPSYPNLKLFIGPYENLVDVTFGCYSSLFIEKSFPIFLINSKTIFKSLLYFKFDDLDADPSNPFVAIDLKKIKYVINNLDKMPNLKSFIFKCRCKKINYDVYKRFIISLLSLKVKNIELNLNNEIEEEFNDNELKDIYKEYDPKNFEKIQIIKIFKKNDKNF